MGVNVSFRDVDEVEFRDFKVAVARHKMKAGEAVSLAFRLLKDYLKQRDSKPALRLWKPHDWGPGSEKDSSRVDEILYGWKR